MIPRFSVWLKTWQIHFLGGLAIWWSLLVDPVRAEDPHRHACEQNLRALWDGVRVYQARRGKLPKSLSTLLEEGIIDRRLLICPAHQARGTNSPSDDFLAEVLESDPGTLYRWQFGDDLVDRRSRAQQTIGVGNWIPIIRCSEHEGGAGTHDSYLNISLNGAVFMSGRQWEHKMRHLVPYTYLTGTVMLDAPKVIPLKQRIPKRSPVATPKQVDLGAAFNAALTDPWPEGYKGEEAPELLRLGRANGLWNVEGIDFEIRGVIQLEGTAAPEVFSEKEPRFPFGMKPLKPSVEAKRVHILCGVFNEQPPETHAATLTVSDVGGKSEPIFLNHGLHLVHGWELSSDASAKLVWKRAKTERKVHPSSLDFGVRSVSYVQFSLKEVRRIEKLEFEAANSKSYPFLLAVTVD